MSVIDLGHLDSGVYIPAWGITLTGQLTIRIKPKQRIDWPPEILNRKDMPSGAQTWDILFKEAVSCARFKTETHHPKNSISMISIIIYKPPVMFKPAHINQVLFQQRQVHTFEASYKGHVLTKTHYLKYVSLNSWYNVKLQCVYLSCLFREQEDTSVVSLIW